MNARAYLVGALALVATAATATIGTAQQASGADTASGMSRERLARIGAAMSNEIQKGTFPGAVTLVARNGKTVHHDARLYGCGEEEADDERRDLSSRFHDQAGRLRCSSDAHRAGRDGSERPHHEMAS